MHVMLPLTKGHLSTKDRIVWQNWLALLELDYCIRTRYVLGLVHHAHWKPSQTSVLASLQLAIHFCYKHFSVHDYMYLIQECLVNPDGSSRKTIQAYQTTLVALILLGLWPLFSGYNKASQATVQKHWEHAYPGSILVPIIVDGK